MSTLTRDKPANTPRSHRHLRNSLYLTGWACFFAWLASGLLAPESLATWLSGMGWLFAMVLWCREDAILAGKPLPGLSLWVVLFTWPIAIPACVIHVYGIGIGLLLALMHIVLYAGLYMAASLLYISV